MPLESQLASPGPLAETKLIFEESQESVPETAFHAASFDMYKLILNESPAVTEDEPPNDADAANT